MTQRGKKYSYYHAGPLFNLSDLTGNAMLAKYIYRESKGRYSPVLPQDLPVKKHDSIGIRNSAIGALLRSDLALFHFDGTEIDSGTVVEYMVAKFADIPAVILRTDFREGKREEKGDRHLYG